MRRYAIVQKARDADVFGILVGTLGVGQFFLSISHFTALIISSFVSPSHQVLEGSIGSASQKVVHDQRREAQPCKIGKLLGNRVLCVGGMSGE